jgi:zinc protease
VRRLAAVTAVLILAGCPGPQPTGTLPRSPAQPTAKPPGKPDAPEPPPPVVNADWDKSGIDWSKPPTSGKPSDVQPPVPVRFTLSNGLAVMVVERPRLPIVSLELIVPHAGSQEDPAKLIGLAALTGDLMDEGAGRRDAIELAAELERQGADLGIGMRPDAARVSLDSLAETLDASLGLLADVLVEPRLQPADFDRIKRERLAALHRRRDRPASVAGLVIDRVLFGGHVYANPPSGYEATVGAISRDDAVDFWRRRWKPAGSTLIVVGAVAARDLKARLEATLGRWHGGRPPGKPELRLPTAQPPRLVVVDRPGATQSAVLAGRILWRRDDPRIHALQVANEALGGSFTSRLMQRLREQLGWTYGSSSYFWFGRGAATWTAEAQLDTPHTAEGVRELLEVIETTRSAPPPADELARARTLLIRQLPQELETNAGAAELLAGLVLEGLPIDWYRTRSAALAKVGARDVQAAATAAWARDSLVVVVVGDLKRIRTGLLGLGLGPAIQVDPDGNLIGPFAP